MAYVKWRKRKGGRKYATVVWHPERHAQATRLVEEAMRNTPEKPLLLGAIPDEADGDISR